MADINSFTEISDELKWGKDTGKQLETLLISYIKALTSNIKDRLGNSPKVIEAYAIFDPLLLPSSDDDSLKEYGDDEVGKTSNLFCLGSPQTSSLPGGPLAPSAAYLLSFSSYFKSF